MRTLSTTIVVLLTTLAHPLQAQQLEAGKDEFVKSCQQCHGMAGKGDGPRTQHLGKRPADLTTLSENNRGVFPFVRVYEVIDGRIDVVQHGPRDMPVWGDFYKRDVKSRMPGNSMSDEFVDLIARRRVLELIEYISKLQGK